MCCLFPLFHVRAKNTQECGTRPQYKKGRIVGGTAASFGKLYLILLSYVCNIAYMDGNTL